MSEENKFKATQDVLQEPKKGRKLIIAVIAILVVIIAIVAFYMLRLNQPRYIFDKKIEQYFSASENIEYNTMKVNADLSLSVNGEDPDVQEIADLVNDAKISIHAEADKETQEEIVGIKFVKNEEELLDVAAKLEIQSDDMYMKLGELFDKTIKMKISEVYDTDVAMFTPETVNPKASSILMKELKAQLKNEYFSKEKTTIENKDLMKNTIEVPLEEVATMIKNICDNLSNNEEFLKCFEFPEETKESLQQISDEADNYIFEEDEYLTIDIYTKGFMKQIVRVDVSMDIEEDNYKVAFTALSESEYSYQVYVNEEEQLTGKINYTNQGNDFSMGISMEADGVEIAMKAEGNVAYDEELSDFDVSEAVNYEELTMDDIYTIMGNFMSSDLYEIFNTTAGEGRNLEGFTEEEQSEEGKAKEEVELRIAEISTEYYEEKYVNENEEIGELDDYIETQMALSSQKTMSGDFVVTIQNKKVEVLKDDEVIATGILEEGFIDWES